MTKDDSLDCGIFSDEELLASVKSCVADGRRGLVRLLRHLAEIKKRRLYAKSCSSLFVFCVRELGFSEAEAQRRVAVATAAVEHPILYRRLLSGRLSLTTAAKLARFLTEENAGDLLERCAGKPIHEVERVVAEFEPKPRPRDSVRALGRSTAFNAVPGRSTRRDSAFPARLDPIGGVESGSYPRHDFKLEPEESPAFAAPPASIELVEIRFAAEPRLFERLERARALLRHKYPAGRFEEVIGDALQSLLEQIDPACRNARRARRRFKREGPVNLRRARIDGEGDPSGPAATGATDRKIKLSRRRRLPAAVRDAVWLRDKGSCAFVDVGGIRCGSRDFLEVDHVVPYAHGGRSDDPSALRLLCREHNLAEARRAFGDFHMSRFLKPRGGARPASKS